MPVTMDEAPILTTEPDPEGPRAGCEDATGVDEARGSARDEMWSRWA